MVQTSRVEKFEGIESVFGVKSFKIMFTGGHFLFTCLKKPPRNTLVQPFALYTDPESHNTRHYRQTDRQTDDITMPIADHTVYEYDLLFLFVLSFCF